MTIDGLKVAWGRLAQSALYRAGRTFVQVYIVTIVAAWQGAGPWTASSLWTAIETQSDFAAGSGIAAALIAIGMRGLDVLKIPSLREAPVPVVPAPDNDTPPRAGPATLQPADTAAAGYAPGTGV